MSYRQICPPALDAGDVFAGALRSKGGREAEAASFPKSPDAGWVIFAGCEFQRPSQMRISSKAVCCCIEVDVTI
jgi:hypothetical protein